MNDKLTALITSKLGELSTQMPGSPLDDDDKHAPEKARSETRRAARIGLWTLGLGFGGFLLWAAFAPLDEGVPGQALVSIDTKRKAVQHQTGGIVKAVMVKEGSTVKAGQVLLRLDDAVAQANNESVRQRYFGLLAMQGRLQAEHANAVAIQFAPDLVAAAKTDPLVAQHLSNQSQLFSTRRSFLASDLQGMEEALKGHEGMLQAYKSQIEGRRTQLKLIQEELGNTRELVKEGYVPRNRQLELERMAADAGNAVADLNGNIIRTQQAILELRQRMNSRRNDYQRDVQTQLADVTREVQSDSAKIQAAANELSRTEVRAPVDGQVVGLAFQTVGGVIGPGARIMDIVPENETLLLEAKVNPAMIDRVVPGQAVDVRFYSFAHTPQLVVDGEVKSVSRDLLTDDATRTQFYLARVALTPKAMKELGSRQLHAGMGAEVVFRTGERSLLTYLAGPFIRRISASMKEQ